MIVKFLVGPEVEVVFLSSPVSSYVVFASFFNGCDSLSCTSIANLGVILISVICSLYEFGLGIKLTLKLIVIVVLFSSFAVCLKLNVEVLISSSIELSFNLFPCVAVFLCGEVFKCGEVFLCLKRSM